MNSTISSPAVMGCRVNQASRGSASFRDWYPSSIRHTASNPSRDQRLRDSVGRCGGLLPIGVVTGRQRSSCLAGNEARAVYWHSPSWPFPLSNLFWKPACTRSGVEDGLLRLGLDGVAVTRTTNTE
jgi:hypothetical protein